MLAIAPSLAPKQLALLPIYQACLIAWPRRPRPSRPARRTVASKPQTRRLKFRNRPPANPRTTRRPAGFGQMCRWIEGWFKAGHGESAAGLYFLCLLPQMRPDSVLYSRDDLWRLELVWLGKGYPHYRLYWKRTLVGVVDIPVEEEAKIATYPKLHRIHSKLARYLACCGFTRHNTVLVEGLASTPPNVRKKGSRKLF